MCGRTAAGSVWLLALTLRGNPDRAPRQPSSGECAEPQPAHPALMSDITSTPPPAAAPQRIPLYLSSADAHVAHTTRDAARSGSRKSTELQLQLGTIAEALDLAGKATQAAWELAQHHLAAHLAAAFPAVTEMSVGAYEHECGRSFSVETVNGEHDSDLCHLVAEDEVVLHVMDVVEAGAAEHEHEFTFSVADGAFR